MIALQSSLSLVKVLRSHFKLGVSVLIGGGVLACTCAALGVDVGHVWRALRRAIGFGPASVEVASKETMLAAGNELSFDGRRVTVRKLTLDVVDQRLAWARIHQKDGWIAFRGETLETVAAEFNLHNGRQLVMGDAATGHLRVGGKFRVTDLDGFLSALDVTHGVKAVPPFPGGRSSQVLVLIGGVSGAAYPDELVDPPAEDDRGGR